MPYVTARSSPKPNPVFAQEEVVSAADSGKNWSAPRRNFLIDVMRGGTLGQTGIRTIFTFNGGKSYSTRTIDESAALTLFGGDLGDIMSVEATPSGHTYALAKLGGEGRRIGVIRSTDQGQSWVEVSQATAPVAASWEQKDSFIYPIGNDIYTLTNLFHKDLFNMIDGRRVVGYKNGILELDISPPVLDPDPFNNHIGAGLSQFSPLFGKGVFAIDQTLDAGGELLYRIDRNGFQQIGTLPTVSGKSLLHAMAYNAKTGALFFSRGGPSGGDPSDTLFSFDHGVTLSTQADDFAPITMFNVSREHDFIEAGGGTRRRGGLTDAPSIYGVGLDLSAAGPLMTRGRRHSRFAFLQDEVLGGSAFRTSNPHTRRRDDTTI